MRPRFLHNTVPVMVEWKDAQTTEGWSDLENKARPLECISVGLLVGRTKDRLIIAMSKSADYYGDHLEIPLGMVKKVRRLR